MAVNSKGKRSKTLNKRKPLITILIIIVFLISIFEIYKLVLKKIYPKNYLEYVSKYAEKYNIEENWIFALIKTESNFEPNSVSSSGAIRTYTAHGKNC